MRPLLGEDAVIVAVIRLRARADLVAFGRCFGGKLAKGAIIAVRGPIEAILVPRGC
jgi:hypothetical protein